MHCTASNHGGRDSAGHLSSSPGTFSRVAQWLSTSCWTWEIRVWEGQSYRELEEEQVDTVERKPIPESGFRLGSY